MYVKLENTRLDFFRKNQATIRADLYQGLLDVLEVGENDASNVGRRVILPPSFIGGPRDMKRRYLNAMSLVQRFGKPDLFVTMTCNPNWPELKEELAPGEQVQNRPGLVARIFRAKLLALKKEIMECKVFGEVAAMIYVVEFQKRGMPHAHFLIILTPAYKMREPDHFDKYVCAEIPSMNTPHLRKVVLSHMMHGPCGVLNPEYACMQKKNNVSRCKSGYPKKFSEFTTTGEDSYPMYRRRDTGEVVVVRRADMDNRWVIPYNPYLLAMFDCHLNVEVCSTIQAVKNLYKYVYKDHDKISYQIKQDGTEKVVDEIEQFQSARWVSPPEAAWRIFAFGLYEMHPPVFPLQIHFPNKQSVQFKPNEEVADVVADERRLRNPLTEFFTMNASHPNGHKYSYQEFPKHFTWESTSRKWNPRVKGLVIGRLTFVSPSEGERYYLRKLLAHVKGPTSFENLRTVDGYLCSTFQEAALRIGLVEQDNIIE